MVVEGGAGGARVNGVRRDRVAGDHALVVGAEHDSNAAAAGDEVPGSVNLRSAGCRTRAHRGNRRGGWRPQ